MILTFTDFGTEASYLGEMRAVLARKAPQVPLVDLVSNAPPFRPDLAGHWLAALQQGIEPGDVVLAIVDPGVGGPRRPVAVEIDGVWHVGPDNGLFEIAVRRAVAPVRSFDVIWRPERLSASFHGRDLFAPVAAMLALKDRSGLREATLTRLADRPDDEAAIITIDRYGNLVTGLRAETLRADACIEAGGRVIGRARTFGDVAPGTLFWYENSLGLAEIAANRASAAALLGLEIGDALHVAGTDALARGPNSQ